MKELQTETRIRTISNLLSGNEKLNRLHLAAETESFVREGMINVKVLL